MAVALMALGLWLRGPRYEVIELGTLGGAHASAMSINNIGQVVGLSKTSRTGNSSVDHAFMWDEEHGIRDLGTLGGASSWANDINDKGEVVGSADTKDGPRHAFLWDVDRGMIDLGTLGGDRSDAYAINSKGQVVGCAETADAQWHAFLWDADGGMVDLGSPYGGRSQACDINEKGQVVGYVLKGRKSHAFYWDADAGMVDLVGANGPSSVANGINNEGLIAGYIFDPQKNNYDACIWTGKGRVERFNTHASESYGGKINDRGQMIGHVKERKFLFFGASDYGFLRVENGRIINLDRYERSEEQQFQACGINNDGWIVGDLRTYHTNVHRVVLLKPKGSGKPVSAARQDD